LQIDHECVLSYKITSLGELMSNIDSYNLDMIVAYSNRSDGEIDDEVLILEIDPYLHIEDEYVFFLDKKYNWEVEVRSLSQVRMYMEIKSEEKSIENMILAAKYFLKNRAYKN